MFAGFGQQSYPLGAYCFQVCNFSHNWSVTCYISSSVISPHLCFLNCSLMYKYWSIFVYLKLYFNILEEMQTCKWKPCSFWDHVTELNRDGKFGHVSSSKRLVGALKCTYFTTIPNHRIFCRSGNSGSCVYIFFLDLWAHCEGLLLWCSWRWILCGLQSSLEWKDLYVSYP